MAKVIVELVSNNGTTVKETERKFKGADAAEEHAEQLASTLAELHLDTQSGDYYEWDSEEVEGLTCTCIAVSEDMWYNIAYTN